MNKLFKLKSWVTLPEAANYLSAVLSEEVSEADILQLSMEGHLIISVSFPNKARAKRGRIVSLEEVNFYSRAMPDGSHITTFDEDRIGDNRYLQLESEIEVIEGIFDLSMLGAERLDVQHRYQALTGGPEITLICLGGVLLREHHEIVWNLQSRMEEQKVRGFDGKGLTLPASYFPAGGLPDDSVLVVRTSALRAFEESLAGEEPSSHKQSSSTKSENTLQKLVIGMAVGGYGYDPSAKKSPIPAEIAADLEVLGLSIDADTVRKWLKESAKHL